MRIVAIRTLNEPLFHMMMKRHIELRFGLLMAAITEFGLRFNKQEVALDCMVRRMATDAAQIVLTVRRAGKVHVVFARTVTLQAALVYLFGQRSLEAENLLRVGIFGMGSARTVAGLTTVRFESLLRLEYAVPVTCIFKPIEYVFVTGFADVRPGVFTRGRILARSILRRPLRRQRMCMQTDTDNGNCECSSR